MASCARTVFRAVDDRLILLLDDILREAEGELFLSLLPELRLAFTYFLPFETDKIAKKVTEIYGGGMDMIFTSPALSQMELEEAIKVDAFCAESRREWMEYG